MKISQFSLIAFATVCGVICCVSAAQAGVPENAGGSLITGHAVIMLAADADIKCAGSNEGALFVREGMRPRLCLQGSWQEVQTQPIQAQPAQTSKATR